MTTFDQILPRVNEILGHHTNLLETIGPLLINRDLNGRVRLIVAEEARRNEAAIMELARDLSDALGVHAFPPEQFVLFETDIEAVLYGAPSFTLEAFPAVRVVDRLATESDWSAISPESPGAPRIVFFSIKGGVGRSTALAATAWALAQAGKRVLVLDLDLESPGLSSALLPEERRPAFGITDWLVEDLVDNGDAVLDNLIATSTLSHDGEIFVVPAHGQEPGEYIAKLGRVWMAKTDPDGVTEPWSARLSRLINALEDRLAPDIVLIDSRAGIDEVAASCITGLGACLVLLFAIDGDQTWSGYQVLFRHWNRAGKAEEIRERLQLVGAMIQDDDSRHDYFAGLRERSWDLFADALYDEIQAGEPAADRFSFDESDESAPHYPWPIRWNRGFAALRSLHGRLQQVDEAEVVAVFGPLINGVNSMITHLGSNS